jgi:D-serine deaminase-like pyridoxal phosphate-dependent protein
MANFLLNERTGTVHGVSFDNATGDLKDGVIQRQMTFCSTLHNVEAMRIDSSQRVLIGVRYTQLSSHQHLFLKGRIQLVSVVTNTNDATRRM